MEIIGNRRKIFKFSLQKRKLYAETIWDFQGFRNSKENSFRGNYLRKYGMQTKPAKFCHKNVKVIITVWPEPSWIKMTNTSIPSKYIPKRHRTCINWNPPFQTLLHKIFKICFLWSKSYSTMLTLRGTFAKYIWSQRRFCSSSVFTMMLQEFCHQVFNFTQTDFGQPVIDEHRNSISEKIRLT